MGFLSNLFKKPKVVRVELDPDSVRENTQIKALGYENAELKADKARLKSENERLRQKDEDKNEEDQIKIELNKQQKELRSKSSSDILLLGNFYERFFKDKKFRDQLAYFTFDRKKKLAKFGNIGFSSDGCFVLLDDKGNIMLKMKDLNDIFQSVGALGYDMSKGMIPINLDEEGDWIENIMIWKAPELLDMGEKMRFAKARKKPVYDIIKSLNSTISDIQEELAESEALNLKLKKRNDQLESTKDLHQEMAETAVAELSGVQKNAIGIDQSFRMLQRELLKYQNMSSISEDYVSQLEKELEEMRVKAEREGIKLADEKAMEILNNMRSTLVNEMPDAVPKKVNPEGKE